MMWLIGISINVIGATLTNLGTILVKYHSTKKNNIGYFKIIGLCLFGVGTILTFISFAYAAQSLLAGIGSFQFVTNLFFAKYFLDEPFSKFNIFGTFLILISIILLIFSFDARDTREGATNDVKTDDIFFYRYYFTLYHLYFIICIFLVSAIFSFFFFLKSGVGIFWLKNISESILQSELALPQKSWVKIVLPLLYLNGSAMICAQSVVAGKMMSLVLHAAISHKDLSYFKTFHPYLPLSVWIALAILWLTQLQRALRIFSGAFIVPLTQVCWVLWTMLSGGVVYGEFQIMTFTQISMFIFGTLILFTGVIFIAPIYTQIF